jgi:protein gp37
MREFVSSEIADVLRNVWLGTSIENSDVAERADALRVMPAAVRFISFEPLIGSAGAINLYGIHWPIVGGESGKAARPIREEWIDEIYYQCLEQKTA